VNADGLSTLLAYSIGRNDKAVLHDSAKSDKFKADPKVAKMLRHGEYYNRVKAFAEVRAVSENGGNDRALPLSAVPSHPYRTQSGPDRRCGPAS
jgi:hypothetical protein